MSTRWLCQEYVDVPQVRVHSGQPAGTAGFKLRLQQLRRVAASSSRLLAHLFSLYQQSSADAAFLRCRGEAMLGGLSALPELSGIGTSLALPTASPMPCMSTHRTACRRSSSSAAQRAIRPLESRPLRTLDDRSPTHHTSGELWVRSRAGRGLNHESSLRSVARQAG